MMQSIQRKCQSLITPVDPMWLSTMRAIENRSIEDMLVCRYEVERAHIGGLPGMDSSFTACSFWYGEYISPVLFGHQNRCLSKGPSLWGPTAMRVTEFSSELRHYSPNGVIRMKEQDQCSPGRSRSRRTSRFTVQQMIEA